MFGPYWTTSGLRGRCGLVSPASTLHAPVGRPSRSLAGRRRWHSSRTPPPSLVERYRLLAPYIRHAGSRLACWYPAATCVPCGWHLSIGPRQSTVLRRLVARHVRTVPSQLRCVTGATPVELRRRIHDLLAGSRRALPQAATIPQPYYRDGCGDSSTVSRRTMTGFQLPVAIRGGQNESAAAELGAPLGK